MKSIIHKININFLLFILFMFVYLILQFVNAQEKSYLAPDVNIISVTPVQGSGINIDRVPGKIQTINRDVVAKRKIFQLRKLLIEKLRVYLCST